MPLHVESAECQRPPRRSFAPSLDRGDSVSPRPTKRRQQLSPAPLTPNHSFDEVSRLGRSRAIPTLPPAPSRLSEKRALANVDPASNSVLKESCIEGWLEEVAESLPIRANSCSPRLENSHPPETTDLGEGQRLSFDILQEMSQLQRLSYGAGSVGSGRSSRPTTSHRDYRKLLYHNGVCIDDTGEKIPPELRSFLDSHILKERSSKLLPGAIAEAVETAITMVDSPESNVYDLTNTAILPIKRSGVVRGGNTPWYSDGLPRGDLYEIHLATPKPDIHLGYPTYHTLDWKKEEIVVIDHPVARRLTQPATGNCFPFFTIELKSEAMGGNLWQAENQAAGSGACCVNTARWVFREAYRSEDQSVVDSIAFSACATHRQVIFHVHFYLAKEDRHYMSWIATCETMRHVQKSNHLVENILEYCLGTRQTKIRNALALLYPFPDHWKNSRPASVMNSQNPSADE